jgi:hypothetical protein
MNISQVSSLVLKSTTTSTVVSNSASIQVNLPRVLSSDDVGYLGKLTVTNLYGIQIKSQSTSYVTNAYGLHVSAPVGATNNYALYVNSGASYFGGNVEATQGIIVPFGGTPTGIAGKTVIYANSSGAPVYKIGTGAETAFGSGGGGTTTNALTIGTGLTGTASTFNGSQAVTVSLNLNNANTWGADQTFNNPNGITTVYYGSYGFLLYNVQFGSSTINHYTSAVGGSVPKHQWYFEDIYGAAVTSAAAMTATGLSVGGNHTPRQALDIKGILRLNGATVNTNYTELKSAATPSSNMTYTLPSTPPTTGQVLSSDSSGTMSWIAAGSGSSTYTKTCNFVGPISVQNGTARWYPDQSVNITGVYINASTAPTSGPFSIAVEKNGSTIATTSLSAGSYASSVSAINISYTSSDYVTIDVTAANGAADVSVILLYTRV